MVDTIANSQEQEENCPNCGKKHNTKERSGCEHQRNMARHMHGSENGGCGNHQCSCGNH